MPNYDYQLKIGADEKVLLQSLESILRTFQSGHPSIELTADARKLKEEVQNAVAAAISQLKSSSLDLDSLLKTDRFVRNLNQATKSLREYQKELLKTNAAAKTAAAQGAVKPAVQTGTSASKTAAFAKTAEADISRTAAAYQDFIETVKSANQLLSALKPPKADGRIFQYLPNLGIISQTIESLRNGVGTITALNNSFTLLNQTSKDSSSALEAFRQKSFQIAEQVGSTGSAVLSAAAGWAGLGYNIRQTADLVKASTVFSNLNTGMDQTAASQSLSAILDTFELNASQAMSVVDKLSALRDSHFGTTSELLTLIQNSALALSVSGDSIDQLLSMGAALNQTVQNAAGAGSILQNVTLRLHDMKAELESTGASTQGMAENTAQLREEILSLTDLGRGGFDILTDTGSLKSTYDILQGIAAVWQELPSSSQSSILGRIAGDGDLQGLDALLSGWSKVDAILQTSQNSTGAAFRENEAQMSSYQGHLTQLQNSLEQFWSASIDPGFLTFFIDAAKGITDFATQLGRLKLILPSIIALFLQMKGASK